MTPWRRGALFLSWACWRGQYLVWRSCSSASWSPGSSMWVALGSWASAPSAVLLQCWNWKRWETVTGPSLPSWVSFYPCSPFLQLFSQLSTPLTYSDFSPSARCQVNFTVLFISSHHGVKSNASNYPSFKWFKCFCFPKHSLTDSGCLILLGVGVAISHKGTEMPSPIGRHLSKT